MKSWKILLKLSNSMLVMSRNGSYCKTTSVCLKYWGAMPQKAREGGFCHVMPFAFLFEMPQNWWISFLIPFLFPKSVAWCPPISFQWFEIFEIPHFRNQMGNWGISRFLIGNIKNFARKNYETDLKRGKILHFKEIFQCRNKINTSFTCFLGHFKVPSYPSIKRKYAYYDVNHLCRVRIVKFEPNAFKQ